MSDALEATKIGVEKVGLPGWKVKTFQVRASDGLLISIQEIGGLKWGEALGLRFRQEEGFLAEGFERSETREEILIDKVKDRKVWFTIVWAGIPEEIERDEIPF